MNTSRTVNKMKKLTLKQQKFAEYYAASGKGSESVRKAGYAHKNADIEASRLLANPSVFDYLSSLTHAQTDNRIASAIERQEFWTAIMRSNEFKIEARLKASEILAKVQGDFVDKLEVSSAMALSDAELDAQIRLLLSSLGY
jgi:phage terminase small subunit